MRQREGSKSGIVGFEVGGEPLYPLEFDKHMFCIAVWRRISLWRCKTV